MSWRERLTEKGKFRGVEFRCEKHDADIGRRTVTKEYPLRNKPRVEDLGLATRRFSLEMFVIGENYDADRDALRNALEKPGPGILIHPWWGKMKVTLEGPARMTETTQDGGMCRITARFVQDGEDLRTTVKINPRPGVLDSIEAFRKAARAKFAAVFSAINAVTAVVQHAIDTVNAVGSVLNQVRGKIAAALLVIDSAKAAIQGVTSTVASLVLTPVALANAVGGMVSAVVEGVTSIGDAFIAVADFFDGEDELPAEGNVIAAKARVDALQHAAIKLRAVDDSLPEVPTGSAQQQEQQRINQGAVTRLFKAECISSLCENAVELTYESYDQARAVRTQLLGFIDDLIVDPDLGDEVYGPLADLRSRVAEYFDQVASELPELADYVPRATVPAIVLAYQIYGDAEREAEILARNPAIRDPSAVRADQTLKVLVDE